MQTSRPQASRPSRTRGRRRHLQSNRESLTLSYRFLSGHSQLSVSFFRRLHHLHGYSAGSRARNVACFGPRGHFFFATLLKHDVGEKDGRRQAQPPLREGVRTELAGVYTAPSGMNEVTGLTRCPISRFRRSEARRHSIKPRIAYIPEGAVYTPGEVRRICQPAAHPPPPQPHPRLAASARSICPRATLTPVTSTATRRPSPQTVPVSSPVSVILASS